MKKITRKYSTYPHIFLAVFFVINLSVILWLNDGNFIYGLDDGYISLGLAKNIWNGNYGLQGEFSSPASSIIWPFIVAVFAPTVFFDYVPLTLNILFAFAQLLILQKIIHISLGKHSDKYRIQGTIALVAFVLGFNMTGVATLGMEHSLQVLSAMVCAYGVIIYLQKNKLEWWFAAALILAPAIRYEGLSLVVACCFILFFSGRIKISIIIGLLSLVIPLLFSWFLMANGESYLPNSVLVKSFVYNSITIPLIENIQSKPSFGIMFAAFLILLSLKGGLAKKYKLIMLAALFVYAMQIIFGMCLVSRYTIYTHAFAVPLLIFVNRGIILNFLKKTKTHLASARILVSILCVMYVDVNGALFYSSISTRDVYLIQTQITRFVKDYYKKPVAINDIGHISLYQDNYALDLAGLSNGQIRKYIMLEDRTHGNMWLAEAVKEKDIGLAIILSTWFNGLIPDDWILLGRLEIKEEAFSTRPDYMNRFDFYATGAQDIDSLKNQLKKFAGTMPDMVEIKF